MTDSHADFSLTWIARRGHLSCPAAAPPSAPRRRRTPGSRRGRVAWDCLAPPWPPRAEETEMLVEESVPVRRLYTTWQTSVADGWDHAVTDEAMTQRTSPDGWPVAVC